MGCHGRDSHYLSIKFREIIQEVCERRNLPKNDISLHWIIGHRNIQGNKVADKEAKRAALDKNSSSHIDQLPAFLKDKLPISMSALKQKHREDLHSRWRKSWSISKRYSHISRIDSSTLSKKFIKATASVNWYKMFSHP